MQQNLLHCIKHGAIVCFIETPRARVMGCDDRRQAPPTDSLQTLPSRFLCPSRRSITMAEATATAKPKTKPVPQFEAPFATMASDAPAAFRDMAEKSLSHAKDSY